MGGSTSEETPAADVAVAERAGAGLLLGLLAGLTRAAKFGTRVGPAACGTTERASGLAGLLGRRPPDPFDPPGCLVGDELGLGVADGAGDVGVGDGAGAGVVAVGEADGAGVVAVGEADGAGAGEVADVAGAADGVGPACALDGDGPGAAVGTTVSAAATPAPDQQVMAAAAPAVTAPRAMRAFRFAPRAWPPAGSADICPP